MYHTIQPNNTTMNDTQDKCRLSSWKVLFGKAQERKKNKMVNFKMSEKSVKEKWQKITSREIEGWRRGKESKGGGGRQQENESKEARERERERETYTQKHTDRTRQRK